MTDHIDDLNRPDIFATLTVFDEEGREEKRRHYSAEGVSLVDLIRKGQRVSLRGTFTGGQVLRYRKEQGTAGVFVYKEVPPSKSVSGKRAYDLDMVVGHGHPERMNFIQFDQTPGVLHFSTLGLKLYPECREHAIVMQTTFSVSCIRSGQKVVCPHFVQIRDWAMERFLSDIWKERPGTREFRKSLPSEPKNFGSQFMELAKDQGGVIAYDPFADKGVIRSSFGLAMVPAIQVTRRPPVLTVGELVGVNDYSLRMSEVNWFPGVRFIASGVRPLFGTQ
ncbi:MAG TPA: hypothetical protein VJJ73_00950 [Candidatus Paceibacterota bacterium]